MRAAHKSTRAVAFLITLYLVLCFNAGVLVADGALHPARRALSLDQTLAAHEFAASLDAEIKDVSITTPDGVVLRAWRIHPNHSNGDAVILLHGQSDNRNGMIGYAQLLLAHGYTVLMPDARAHGESGGGLATYGLLERNDIHQWFDWLAEQHRPRCIFGFGESMGASQLLQSLDTGTHFCAVAAESPFSTFREIGYDRMGQPFHLGSWFGRTVLRPVVKAAVLRARWKYKLNLKEISPESSVSKTKIPVLLIHGQVDSNIPVRHSRLIRAHNPNVVLWEVPKADHCGAISVAPQEFENKLIAWFQQSPLRTKSKEHPGVWRTKPTTDD
jgi:uncharacterized protein